MYNIFDTLHFFIDLFIPAPEKVTHFNMGVFFFKKTIASF
jgi:hypothetical protein